MKRASIVVLVTIAVVLFMSTITTRAQIPEPTATIDAVLKDLGGKLGQTLTRRDVSYTYERVNFPDSSLGCPRPGVMYTQVVTAGYKILVTVTATGTTYDYRASESGDRIFQCEQNGVATAQAGVTAVPTSTPPPLTAVPSVSNPPAVITNPIAYVGADGNVIVADPITRSSIPLTSDAKGKPSSYYPYYEQLHIYGLLRWSPDGSKLAFVDSKERTLYIARSGQKPVIVASGLTVAYPPAWSADSNELAYAVPTKQTSGTNGVINQIQAIPANQGGQARVAGQFSAGVGCGGGGFDPAVAAYFSDVGYEGNRVMLEQVANGYLYTSACTGIGLGLAAANGQGSWVRNDLSAAALSPDRTRLIAVRHNLQNSAQPGGGLELVDLATGKGTDLSAQPNVSQVGWSADGQTILYSTVTSARQLNVTASNSVAAQVFSGVPFSAPVNTITLWTMPANGGNSTQLLTREGFAIGNIWATQDGNILFSFVNSLADMVHQLDAGKPITDVVAAAPTPQLYTVPLTGGTASLYNIGSQPAIATGQFAAVLSVSAGAGVVTTGSTPPPPALVIGQTAVVSASKSNLNLRATPSTGAEVKRLLTPGTVVTILAGPQPGENYRWWQVRAPDGSTGWVVDQVTDADGTTDTLTPQGAG